MTRLGRPAHRIRASTFLLKPEPVDNLLQDEDDNHQDSRLIEKVNSAANGKNISSEARNGFFNIFFHGHFRF